MKIKARTYFFCSDIRQHLPEGKVADVSKAYGDKVIAAGFAEEVKSKKDAPVDVETAPKAEAKPMTTKKSLKKGTSKKN